MPEFNHVMVDIETTGLQPDRHAIIQITAIRFDPYEFAIDHNWFNECLMMPSTRSWDEGTRQWWSTKREVFQSIQARMQPAPDVMKRFHDWVGGQSLYFWAKPLSFDFPFIQSYFHEFGPQQCFQHWKGRDLRSFVAGMAHPQLPTVENEVEFEGPQHDALFDTIHQIKILFHSLNHREQPSCSSSCLELSTE